MKTASEGGKGEKAVEIVFQSWLTGTAAELLSSGTSPWRSIVTTEAEPNLKHIPLSSFWCALGCNRVYTSPVIHCKTQSSWSFLYILQIVRPVSPLARMMTSTSCSHLCGSICRAASFLQISVVFVMSGAIGCRLAAAIRVVGSRSSFTLPAKRFGE